MRKELFLPSKQTESLRVKTFGSADGQNTICEVVQLGLSTKNGEILRLTALVIPFICNSLTSQPISYSQECYAHLMGLESADSSKAEDVLEVDVLIG